MTLVILILGVLLLYLWLQQRKTSDALFKVNRRLIHFDRTLDELAKKLKDLGEKSPSKPGAPPAEAKTAGTTPPEKEPVLKKPVAERIVSEPPLPQMKTPKAPAADDYPPVAPHVEPLPQAPKPSPPPPRTPPPTFAPPSWKLPKFDWEGLVGVKLFSWIAAVALLLAAVFFLRYSINQGWLMPPVRLAIGIIVGIGLIILCELKAARKYPVTANALDASAIAILFASFYSAHARWDLIGWAPAFILMALVTAVAVLLSIRRDSIFIALLGLIGAFATPSLLSTGESRPISLFSYILLLNAGLAWVATKKKWPLLTTLTLIFTALYQWDWVMKFLTADQLPLAFGIFLVFPILAFIAIWLGQEERPDEGWISLHGQTANLSALLPLLFALYVAAVPAYGGRYMLLFGFLFLLTLGLFAISALRGPEILHVVGAISTVLVFALWFSRSYESHAWPEILFFALWFSLFYLAAPFMAKRFGRDFNDLGKRAVYAAPLLLFAFPVLALVEPACASPVLIFGTLFVILLATAAYAVYSEEGPVYFIAALFALLAEAVWATKHLDPEHLLSGLAIFGIFGLFYIGVPISARKWNKKLHPKGAAAGLLLISLALLFFLTAGTIASTAIWGLAFLMLILNVGLFWEGVAGKLPVLAIAGVILSWIILAVLWASVSLAVILIPALMIVAGFALIVLAGNIWMQRKTTGTDDGLLRNGLFLSLAGHLFLFAVVTRSSLSIPPWPFLGILLLLDLAIGAAVLYTRRNDLHLAAMLASGFLLIVWAMEAVSEPWPGVAILSAAVLSLFSIIWVYLAKRRGIDSGPFFNAASITIVLAQVVAITAAAQAGSPGIEFLIPVHAVFLAAILGLEWLRGKYAFVLASVLPTAVAVSSWLFQHREASLWPQKLLFASVMYLIFIGYPLLLGRRCGRSLAPYLAAVLAGIPFFFQARHAMIQAGWGNAIGILPVVQAFLTAFLMLKLLGIEQRGERYLGRLALVAGTVLAFITVAIPLQLEKEWITIAWALEAAALAWLYGKIPHKGLLYALSGLYIAVFARLALNPSVLTYQPRGETRIWNWYLYTYLVSAAAMILGGRLFSKMGKTLAAPWHYLAKILPAAGIVLLFLLLNIEIADFFSTGPTITFNFTATLAQDMTYTLAWALFAVALLAAGIMIRSQPARIASLALLVVTILKCFIHDLARLGELYRVASFVGLAVCLALVAVALQKYVLSARKEEK